jgi:CubicO group peptidase (beta-lactamase class C family)
VWSPANTGVDPELAEQLRNAVDRWSGYWGIPGIRIAIARPDSFAWQQAFGVDWDGKDLDVNGTFDIESITKTVTATITWQLWQEGKIDLDAPIARLDGLPDFPPDRFTVRELLNHRTALPDYHNTAAYAPEDLAPVERAIMSALIAPNLGEPDSWQFYSSTNYLILGRYLETITNEPLDTLIRERLLEPYGMEQRFARAESTIEAPGGGAAGLVGTLDSLLVWGDTLLRRHAPLGEDAWNQMATLAESSSLGAGVYGYCPCAYDDNGRPTWQRIGHSGGTTSLEYDPGSDILFAYQVPTGVWDTHTTPLEELIDQLTTIIANYPFK